MNNLTTSILLVAKWWNPFSWGDALGDAIEAVQALLNNVIVTSAGFALEKMTGLFNTSVNALRSEVAITPAEFDGNMLDILKMKLMLQNHTIKIIFRLINQYLVSIFQKT